VSALYGYNLNNSGHITYLSLNKERTSFKDNIQYDYENDQHYGLVSTGFDRFLSSPVDTDDYDIYKEAQNDNITNYHQSLYDVYRHSFVELISETNYNEASFNVTEKFSHSIFACNLPIVVSSPGYVDFARSLGFDMFDDIIDHSYDNEPDKVKRIHKLINDNMELLYTDKASSMFEKNKQRLLNNCELLTKQLIPKYSERFWNLVEQSKF